MAQSHREAEGRLFEVAVLQQGFFTAKQAKGAGFAENTHPYHVKVGNWIREHCGIYSLALYPTADRPDLVLWALWSRNRNERSEEHTSELQSHLNLVCRLLLEKKTSTYNRLPTHTIPKRLRH